MISAPSKSAAELALGAHRRRRAADADLAHRAPHRRRARRPCATTSKTMPPISGRSVTPWRSTASSSAGRSNFSSSTVVAPARTRQSRCETNTGVCVSGLMLAPTPSCVSPRAAGAGERRPQQVGVRDHDALRRAGGARGVGEDGEILRAAARAAPRRGRGARRGARRAAAAAGRRLDDERGHAGAPRRRRARRRRAPRRRSAPRRARASSSCAASAAVERTAIGTLTAPSAQTRVRSRRPSPARWPP